VVVTAARRKPPKRTTTSNRPFFKLKQASIKTAFPTSPAQTITASTEVVSEDGSFPIVGIGSSADMEETNRHHLHVKISTPADE
jgi:hypothetical protein